MKRRHVRDMRECTVRGGKWTYTFLILLKCTEINRDCTPSLNNSAVLSSRPYLWRAQLPHLAAVHQVRSSTADVWFRFSSSEYRGDRADEFH